MGRAVAEIEELAFYLTQDFYDRVQNQEFCYKDDNGKIVGLTYRDDQRTLSYNVLDSFFRQQILIQEAGVGTGKTMAYLIPLICTYIAINRYNNEPRGFVISTSTIALQEQIQKEIKDLVKTLNNSRFLSENGFPKINLPVAIAKGYNNYVCIKRANRYLDGRDNDKDKEIIREIFESNSPDRLDKTAYSRICCKSWENIRIRNLDCRRCSYKDACLYRLTQKKLTDRGRIVVVNHDILVNNLKDVKQGRVSKIHQPSYLIIDEAHTLEERIIDAYAQELDERLVEKYFNALHYLFEGWTIDENKLGINFLINSAKRVVESLKLDNKEMPIEQEENIIDEGRYPFTISKETKEIIQEYLKVYELFYRGVENFEWTTYEKVRLLYLIDFSEALREMCKIPKKRSKIFWVSYPTTGNGELKICYVDKKISHLSARLFNEKDYGLMFTSATLATGTLEDGTRDMEYLIDNLGLKPDEFSDNNLVFEPYIKSPYDYDNNTMMYLSKNTLSPKTKNHSDYLDSITDEIDRLINSSHGRGLILFTSKSDMREVHSKLKERPHKFNIYIQNDNNSDMSKRKFIADKNSCLLSTGFWEGIDVKGEPLEHVIIVKLPFPIVDPVIEAKDEMHGEDHRVYLSSMMIKLLQGTGRLIRGEKDRGVVSILDSRIFRTKKYMAAIENALPFSRVTSDIEDVGNFFGNKQQSVKSKKIGKKKR